MKRKNCKCERTIRVTAKCSDMCNLDRENTEQTYEGYVPKNLCIGSGDYIEFSFCLDCGRIQNFVPVEDETLDEVFE